MNAWIQGHMSWSEKLCGHGRILDVRRAIPIVELGHGTEVRCR